MIQFGIESELGITRTTDRELDMVAESIALVRSAKDLGVSMRWDYGAEDPHVDARGFRVNALRQDEDEKGYFEQDARRELSVAEIKSDLVLSNGARFYNDHAHPEYCTPECADPDELVAQDRAGERIAMQCAERLAVAEGEPVRLYKNNTDFQGHSYGCHENYLMPRDVPWDALAGAVEAFLVTRQVFAGAGKFGVEAEDRFVRHGFQISQRSDFFTERQSVDTMQKRPLINTRDEPHADPRRYRRFHVILGDANMSPFATWLKVGTLALVLEAIVVSADAGWPALRAPVEAVRAISLDPGLSEAVAMADGTIATGLDIQRRYLDGVRRLLPGVSGWKRRVLEEWQRVLDDLAVDPERCVDRLDWVAKRALIGRFQQAEGIAPDDPWLCSLDLEYHRLDPEEGLFFGLEAAGAIRAWSDKAAIDRAMCEPPESTRAWIRGACVSRFATDLISVQWDHIELRGSRGPIRVSLLDLFDPARIRQWREVVERAERPDDLLPLTSMT